MSPHATIVRPGIFLLTLAVLLPQDRTSPNDAVIRINVNLVQIDAVVTDKQGRPVTDLQPAEFEILQDDRRQNITNFSYIATRPDIAATPVAAQRGGQRRQAAAPPPVLLKPEQIRRTVALVVDDLALSFGSVLRIRQSLHKVIDQELQPGDLIAVIRTGAGMGALQQFSSDRRLLHTAIDHIRFNALGRVGVESFTPLGSEPAMPNAAAGRAQANANEFRRDVLATASLAAIRFVIDGLRDLPSRKYIVLFSENLQIFNRTATGPVDALVQHLTDAANRASVVLYSIDPRIVESHMLTAADNTRYSSPQQIAGLHLQRSAQEFYSRDGLVALAASTGGLFLHDSNDLDSDVRKVIRDTEGYYLIGYHPESSTFEKTRNQPARFHRITVRVKRAGLQVRSRSGFFGAPDRESQAAPPGREAEIARALRSPFSASGIHVRLTPLFSNSAGSGSYLKTMLYIDGSDLEFSNQPDGRHQALLDLVAMTFGESGEAVDTTTRAYTIRAPTPLYEEAVKHGMLYSVVFPVKRPGAYQMRVVVRDAGSARLGSANQFIEVPDVQQGRLTLSSIILRGQVQAKRAADEQAEGQVAEADPQANEAVRVFQRGQPIEYHYEIYNAQTDAGKQSRLESQTRVFRDGQEVYAGKFTPLEVTGPSGASHLETGGILKFNRDPGDYVLQVIVSDKLAKDKYGTASQWMDFQLR